MNFRVFKRVGGLTVLGFGFSANRGDMLDRAIDEEQKVHNDFLILVRTRGPPLPPK